MLLHISHGNFHYTVLYKKIIPLYKRIEMFTFTLNDSPPLHFCFDILSRLTAWNRLAKKVVDVCPLKILKVKDAADGCCRFAGFL